ncbi:unnamed protein product, partial [Iphiclides podalirius]
MMLGHPSAVATPLSAHLSAHWKLSPQPPHLKRACGSVGAAWRGGLGGARGGAAHEHAGSAPAAHARATDHESAAADMAYTYACSRVPADALPAVLMSEYWAIGREKEAVAPPRSYGSYGEATVVRHLPRVLQGEILSM